MVNEESNGEHSPSCLKISGINFPPEEQLSSLSDWEQNHDTECSMSQIALQAA